MTDGRGRSGDRNVSSMSSWGSSRRNVAQGFLRADRGTVAIYFALGAIVFVGAAGLAIDAARGYLVKARLSEAIDVAALAGGKALQTASDDTKPTADARAFFDANFPDGAMGATVSAPTVTISNNSTVVTVSATATIPTTLMRILGIAEMTVSSTGSVARAATGLDVVFSFDVSGSMCQPCSKIDSLRTDAKELVDALMSPFTNGLQQQIVTVNGTQYSLLNIGVVPWSAKVNVRTFGHNTTGTVTPTTTSFTDPMGQRAGTQYTYMSSNSEVPLLYDPSTLHSGWTGCVYARYREDANENNDADLSLGAVTVGGKEWPGWEPMDSDESDTVASGSCDQAAWNSGNAISPSGNPRPANWPDDSTGYPTSLQNAGECPACPTVGILPLQSDTQQVKDMIDLLQAGGNTDAPQGLFWAWEVLMPGEPFDEAKLNPPFQRAQAIVFMTDGKNYGSNGDAYHGWFGSGDVAATTTDKGYMTMPDGSTAPNNLNSRLLALAQKIKGPVPQDPSAVKIFVIQYMDPDPTLQTLLSSVATQPAAPYYFYAPDAASLSDIFAQIGASLSALRIVQ